MQIKNLIKSWQHNASTPLLDCEWGLKLSVEDIAKLRALTELYPKRHPEELLSELLSAALQEFEQQLPYVAGNKIIAHDEMGDPLFEDIGLTPRFQKLTREHLGQMQGTKH